MTEDDRKLLSGQLQPELDDALAALIASTKRVNRKLNLIDISKKLSIARRYLGSLQAVASAVGVSPEMLRQFTRIEALAPPVKVLIKKGKINSVDTADRISRLPAEDQLYVADKAAKGEFKSSDVRAIVAYRKAAPNLPIDQVVHKVVASKNIREYVIEFRIPKHTTKRTLRLRLISFFGENEICGITTIGAIGEVCITEEGRYHLEGAAKERRLTKRQMVDLIISGEHAG